MDNLDNLTPDEVSLKILNDGLFIRNVKNPSNDQINQALQQNGLALHYVKQTPERCLTAVKQNGRALMFVKKQSPEICLEAVKNDPNSIKYVLDHTEEVCLEVVKKDGLLWSSCRCMSQKIIIEAIRQNYQAIEDYIGDDPEVYLFFIKKYPEHLEKIRFLPNHLKNNIDGLIVHFNKSLIVKKVSQASSKK